MESSKSKNAPWGTFMKAILPLLIIVAGGAAFAYFKTTAPRIKRTTPKPQPALVEVLEVGETDVHATVTVMGTVVPSREVALRARVPGEIQKLSREFIPGGHIAKGEVIVRLDPSDYDVAIEKALGSLEKAEADLALEEGNQTIAREELQLLRETSSESLLETDLLLRKPQLRQALAAVSTAKAELRQARLNHGRTTVRAPFNALVVEREVNLGSHVGTQDTLAFIVSTDEYWVEAAVPLDRLSAIHSGPENGSLAMVRSQAGNGAWQGRVVRITGKLTEKTRLASVIIAIPDPLGLHAQNGRMPLILDDYVSVEIQGRRFSSVMDVPRSALRDNDTVWVYQEGLLDVRAVTVVWKQKDRVFVRDGFSPGEKIIISDLAAPVEGMALAIAEDADTDADTMTKVYSKKDFQ